VPDAAWIAAIRQVVVSASDDTAKADRTRDHCNEGGSLRGDDTGFCLADCTLQSQRPDCLCLAIIIFITQKVLIVIFLLAKLLFFEENGLKQSFYHSSSEDSAV
jgi:hypothetical protein